MNINWFKNFSTYTISKYGMSMYVLGMAEEFKKHNIAVNGLWPRIVIATDSVRLAVGGSADALAGKCRKPDIMADATVLLTTKSCKGFTGRLLIDETLLRAEGVSNFDKYLVKPGTKILLDDLFIPGVDHPFARTSSKATPNKNNINLIFEDIYKAIKNDMFKSIEKSFKFEIISDDKKYLNHTIHVDFRNKKLIKGENNAQADVTIVTSNDTIQKLFSGELDPIAGLLGGDYKLIGNYSDAKLLDNIISIFNQKCKT